MAARMAPSSAGIGVSVPSSAWTASGSLSPWPVSTQTTTSSEPMRYVALGDSYTSGPLIPFQRLDRIGCLRSTNNYPSVVARRLGHTVLTDVSCAGADTTDVTRPQELAL